jgi:hypothetical protein
MDTKINDDWKQLNVDLTTEVSWSSLFSRRQEAIQKLISKSEILICDLRNVIVEYAVRAWVNFEKGDLIAVRHAVHSSRVTAVVADVEGGSLQVTGLFFVPWVEPTTSLARSELHRVSPLSSLPEVMESSSRIRRLLVSFVNGWFQGKCSILAFKTSLARGLESTRCGTGLKPPWRNL